MAHENKYPLHKAVEAKDEKLVRKLIKAGYNVNELDWKGKTPLHLTATRPLAVYPCHSKGQCIKFEAMSEEEAQCRVRIAERLIKAGANVNSLSIADAELMKLINFLKFTTSLQQAALCQNDTVAEILLQHGADVSAKSGGTGNTALHWTMTNFRGNINLVKILLEYGADVKATNNWGNTPLNLAAKNSTGCSVKLIKLFLKHGADINAKGNEDNTPLHSVVTHFRLNSKLVKILLERGSDANAVNSSGLTPLYLAIKNPTGCSGKLIELFVKHGADINYKEIKLADTPLHWAVGKFDKSTKLVRNLLRHGSNINAVNHFKETPLHLAIGNTKCSIKLIKVLLKHGADVDHKHKNLNASQKYIATYEPLVNPTILKLLLLSSIREENRMNPLHYACLFHQVESVRKLLREGADPSAKDRFGYVPMFYALISLQPNKKDCKYATIRLLIDFGAEHDQECIFPEFGKGTFLLSEKHDSEILDMFTEYAVKRLVLHNGVDLKKLQKFCLASSSQNQRKRKWNGSSDGEFPFNVLRPYARRNKVISPNYEYVQELRAMRDTKVGETEISYLDLLDASSEKIAVLVKNKQMVNDFHAGKNKFVVYRGILEASFYKGYARMKLIEKAAEMLSMILCGDHSLELHFRKHLINYKNEELNRLIE